MLREIITTHEKYPAMGLDSIYQYLKPIYGVSRARIHRLMKKYNIHSLRTKSYKQTTNSNHNKQISPNLLMNKDFEVTTPNAV